MNNIKRDQSTHEKNEDGSHSFFSMLGNVIEIDTRNHKTESILMMKIVYFE